MLTTLTKPNKDLKKMCFYLRLGDSSEGTETDEKVVSELRSELWEKERKLTDIRLEALSSAHQLEQLQEAMSKMQVCEESQSAQHACTVIHYKNNEQQQILRNRRDFIHL